MPTDTEKPGPVGKGKETPEGRWSTPLRLTKTPVYGIEALGLVLCGGGGWGVRSGGVGKGEPFSYYTPCSSAIGPCLSKRGRRVRKNIIWETIRLRTRDSRKKTTQETRLHTGSNTGEASSREAGLGNRWLRRGTYLVRQKKKGFPGREVTLPGEICSRKSSRGESGRKKRGLLHQ